LKYWRVGAISETQSFEGNAMPTTEESIIAAARLRAAYRGENEAMAAASALEALAVLKKTLKGDKYQEALERLFLEYSTS
jgi:hypothetical protein